MNKFIDLFFGFLTFFPTKFLNYMQWFFLKRIFLLLWGALFQWMNPFFSLLFGGFMLSSLSSLLLFTEGDGSGVGPSNRPLPDLN